MVNKNLFRCAVAVFALSLLGGCQYADQLSKKLDDKVKCNIAVVSDEVKIDYKGKSYVVLDETVSVDDMGEWVGYINKNISGLMFSTVYQDKSNGMLDVAVDNLYYRAVEEALLTDQQTPLVITAPSGNVEGTVTDASVLNKAGPHSITVDPDDINRLICDGTYYRVTDQKISEDELGEFICSIAEYVVYDTDTYKVIDRATYTKIDWKGEDNQNREIRVYGNVNRIGDTDNLGVEINGDYYITKQGD